MLIFAEPLFTTAQSTYTVSLVLIVLLSMFVPVVVETTILSDHPDGLYGVRLGRTTVAVGVGVEGGVGVAVGLDFGVSVMAAGAPDGPQANTRIGTIKTNHALLTLLAFRLTPGWSALLPQCREPV